jgi:hypothetical protein
MKTEMRNIYMRIARAALEGVVVLAFMATVIVFAIGVAG